MIKAVRNKASTIKVSFVTFGDSMHQESQSISAALELSKSLRLAGKESVAVTIELTPEEVQELIATKMARRKAVAQ